jgi:NO-binding membrane sensor protein with MHYT domain
MAHIHHFDHGWITPTVSYVLSVLGSMLGLTCAVRLRAAQGRGERIWWLILASIALGGTAIWSMHFVAMMGFSVVGTPIRYDVGLTIASAIIPIIAVALGVAIVAFGSGYQNVRLIIGGVLSGLGIVAMHYLGMAAMQLNGDISYSMTRVGLSIGIAVVAATVALWLSVTVQKPLAIFGSALVMGVAVNGMHFTGMSAMSVMEHSPEGNLAGASASSMLVPIGLGVVFALIGLVYALMAAPNEEDRAAAAYLAGRREASAASARQRAGMTGATGAFGTISPSTSAERGGSTSTSAERGGSTSTSAERSGPTLSGNWTYRDRSSR